MRVDLHIHSTASDGTWTPAEIVERAHAAGLGLIALTDHDTLGGVPQAQAAAAALGMRVLAAVEFNTDAIGREIDILGYFDVLPTDPALRNILQTRERARVDRAMAIVAKLQAIGLPVSYDRVREIAGGIVARPHVAQAMMEKGYVTNQHEAYERYLGMGAPAFVAHDLFHPAEAIRAIRHAGGLPIVAHPGLIGDDASVQMLIDAGVGGLEAYYPEHSAETVARYSALAKANHLVVTAGTDCHGPGRKKSYPIGSVTLPEADQAAFLTALAASHANRTEVQ